MIGNPRLEKYKLLMIVAVSTWKCTFEVPSYLDKLLVKMKLIAVKKYFCKKFSNTLFSNVSPMF